MGYMLTNGDRQEFYVRIKGPDESMWCYALYCMRSGLLTMNSTVFRWPLENPRRTTRSIPLQESQYWLREPDFPPEY